MNQQREITELLLKSGRLLLEFSDSSSEVQRALRSAAKALTEETCHVRVFYSGLTVSLAGQPASFQPVKQLHYNMAVLAKVHSLLGRVRRGEVDPTTALVHLERIEVETPRHALWFMVLMFGLAAACLARILGADLGAVGVAGISAGLGLLVRSIMGRWHMSLLTHPLAAAFLGAVLGGLAIRWGWTQSPELVLIVPALMLVPGPHFINGLMDLLDNHVPMSLARLGLAFGILCASAMGVLLGVELTVKDPIPTTTSIPIEPLNLPSDMALAAIVACGFAVFYNTAWGNLWMAAVAGMIGHGLRFVCIESGTPIETATFIGALAVGVVSACMAHTGKTSASVIGFAGAVIMMPGLAMYRTIGGVMILARQGEATSPSTLAGTLGNFSQACLVVLGLAVGLILGVRLTIASIRIRSKANKD